MAALGGDTATRRRRLGPPRAGRLRAVDETADDGAVSDATWAVLAAPLDEAELIELLMLIAHYLMLTTRAALVPACSSNPGRAAAGCRRRAGGPRHERPDEGSGDAMRPLLEGRCIAVVGAGTQPSRDPDAPVGNGRAIAVRAAREGASVVCVDSDEEAVEATWRQITEEGGKAAIVVADVTTEEGCRLAVAEEAGLAPDGIVLNVGTGFGMGVAGTSPEDWDRTFALNLRAHFMLVRRALVILPDNGSIVFIGSVAGLRPGSRIPAYDASKAGLIGLNRHVAMEGARRGIRANVLVPGPDRHPAGPGRLGRAALADPDAGAAGPRGHGMGGGRRRRLPALRRGELHHRPGAGRRRGPDAAV